MGESKKLDHQLPLAQALLVSVAVGVAGSIVVVPLTYLQIAATLAHSYLVALTLGLWVIPCLLPLLLVKRPGAALLACGAIGVISAVATPFGLSAIPALLFEGLIVEIPFLVTLYRSWRTIQYYIAGGLLGAFMGFMVPYSTGVKAPSMMLPIVCMLIALVSAMAGTWLCFLIRTKVGRTGVLDEQQ
ncbi:ECF transporter S component [Schaalia sp. ZJ1691]|uniref:ECF transporter S component n=1 Tax=Schaalia sp. ZJ1691 TaxID=2709404 RepID=UPI0013EA6B20|nr:ECF transporter S component [Schaalia sp. ZJ1691]